MMACNVSPQEIIKIYNNLSNQKKYFLYLKDEILQLLPSNAYQICSNKVYIIATRVSIFGFQKKIFSVYDNNEDLVDAALASSNMPFFVSPYLFYKYKNHYYLDGCFSNILPHFKDDSANQLLIKLYKIKYFPSFSYIPSDPSIEGLIVKGCIEADKFFLNTPHNNIDVLQWYDIHYNKKKYTKIFICGFGCICGCIIFCKFLQSKKK
jgi:hypothetical protein